MTKKIYELFDEKYLIKKIKEKLPYLFQLAEIDNSRDGKLGMEIGSRCTVRTHNCFCGWKIRNGNRISKRKNNNCLAYL